MSKESLACGGHRLRQASPAAGFACGEAMAL